MVKLVSAALLREMAAKSNDRSIVLERDSILTPSARDMATEMGLIVTKQCDRVITRKGKHYTPFNSDQQATNSYPANPGQDASPSGVIVNQIVQKVLDTIQQPVCVKPGLTPVRGDSVVVKPFQADHEGQQAGVSKVITSREANLTAGFMTFDHSELAWYANCDEINYVVDGEYVLRMEDREFHARAGDVLYIPRGTRLVFSSTGTAKVFYVAYPANWDEMSK